MGRSSMKVVTLDKVHYSRQSNLRGNVSCCSCGEGLAVGQRVLSKGVSSGNSGISRKRCGPRERRYYCLRCARRLNLV